MMFENTLLKSSSRLFSSLLILLSQFTIAQTVSLDPDSYEQEYLGTGASVDLWLGPYLSMSLDDQIEASRILYQELRLKYVKEYVNSTPLQNPNHYDNMATIFKRAQSFNPEAVMVVTTSDLPDHLERRNNEGKPVKGEHDKNIPGIMDSVANYYFDVCKGYHDRGVSVEILELVNERGFSDGLVTQLFEQAATKFRSLIEDSSFNVTQVPMPLIAGPSTWSASSPKTFINGWKANNPEAWSNTDIVTTHAYQNGTESSFRETFNVSDGKPFYQSEQTAKIQRDENPGIDPIGDQFPYQGFDFPFLANVTIARHMIEFFNGGGNAFWHFLATNPPSRGGNSTLLKTSSSLGPYPADPFYGFKHLSATQPRGSKKISQVLTNTDSLEIVSFRKEGEDTIYVHFINLYDTYKSVIFDFENYGIKRVFGWTTDEALRFTPVMDRSFSTSVDKVSMVANPYSVNTLKVVVDPQGIGANLKEQTLEFTSIPDQMDNVGTLTLSTTATSGLEATYEVVKGPAEIVDGNKLKILGAGYVRIEASQGGNEEYLVAPSLDQTFLVNPTSENVSLDKPASASGTFRNDELPGLAFDGNVSGNDSRWLSPRNDDEDSTSFEQWLEVDLLGTYEIEALKIYVGGNGRYNNHIWQFDFQAEINGRWVNIISEQANRRAIYVNSFEPVKTKKVRLFMQEAPDNFIARVYEMEVYGQEVPKAPSGLKAKSFGLNTIDIGWIDNTDDESGFILERMDSANKYLMIADLPANTIEYTDTALSPGTEYTYRISSYRDGTSSEYAIATLSTLDIKANAPNDLSLTLMGGSFIQIRWGDNSDNEDGFLVERKTSGAEFVKVKQLATNSISYLDTDITPDNFYTYRVAAFNNAGNSGYSNELVTPSILAAPTKLTAEVVEKTNILLNWTDNSTKEDRYLIERKSSGDFTVIDSVLANVSSYLDEGAELNTEYTYRIIAKTNNGESNYSNSASAQAKLTIGTPTILELIVIDSTQIELNWVDNSDNETGFVIERKSTGDGDFVVLDTVAANVIKYISSGLRPATEYTFRVCAFGVDGHSDYTNVVKDTTEELVAAVTGVKSVEEFVLAPNPFSDYLSIEFILTSLQAIQITVLDISGKHLVDLIDERLNAGRHNLEWNGRDENGLEQKSGLYFLKIQHENNQNVYRIIKK